MVQARQSEKTVWHDEKWRVALKPRTNNPGKKVVAYFKDIRIASYDERGLHDHQDGIASHRIPVRGDVEDIMRIAFENANVSKRPIIYA